MFFSSKFSLVKTLIWLILLLGLLVLAGCGRAGPESEPVADPEPEDALAQVGAEWILQSDVMAYQLLLNRPLDADAALEELIRHTQLAQLAVASGVDDLPEVRTRLRMLLATQLLETTAAAFAEPCEEDLLELYHQQHERFTQPQRLSIAVLRRSFSDGGSQRAIDAMQQARDHFSAPEQVGLDPASGFGAAAANFSDEPDTRFNGGMVGWVTPGQAHFLLPPEVIAAAATLETTGSLSPVITSAHAAWLVRLMHRSDASVRPFEHVRAQLAIEWRQQQQLQAIQRQRHLASEAFPVQWVNPPASGN